MSTKNTANPPIFSKKRDGFKKARSKSMPVWGIFEQDMSHIGHNIYRAAFCSRNRAFQNGNFAKPKLPPSIKLQSGVSAQATMTTAFYKKKRSLQKIKTRTIFLSWSKFHRNDDICGGSLPTTKYAKFCRNATNRPQKIRCLSTAIRQTSKRQNSRGSKRFF